MFNDGNFLELIESGQLTSTILHDEVLTNPQKNQGPPGTRSKIIRYLNNEGQLVVEVAYYRRPDGSVGASGKLDPKRVRIGDTIYTA